MLVPNRAPTEVAMASAKRALSILEEKPELVCHGLLICLGEDAAAAAGADEGADGVKGVGQAEGEDGHQHQGQAADVSKQAGQARGREDHAKGLGQLGGPGRS